MTVASSNNLRLVAFLQRGVKARTLKGLAALLGLGLPEFALAVSIPQRTLDRRMAHNETLRMDEAERALRVARLLAKAREVFEDREEAAAWFRNQLAILGGRSPLELCKTEPGAREVEQTLGRIEHGVFS